MNGPIFVSSMDEQLEHLYRSRWKSLSNAIPAGCLMSKPLLATVPTEYETSDVRLLVIGQQTNGWWYGWDEWDTKGASDPVAWLRDVYRQFDRGRKYRSSPFFRAAKKLQILLNPDSDPFGFMWLDLFVCDQNKSRPNPEIQEKLRKVSFLRDETHILRPHAVIFFTGHAYDSTIQHPQLFPDAEFIPPLGLWSAVSSVGLPPKTARTNHPKNLSLKKQFGVIDEIAAWMKS